MNHGNMDEPQEEQNKVQLLDLYHDMKVMFSGVHDRNFCIITESLSSLYNEALRKKDINIVGPKGIGKSTALMYVFSELIKEKKVCIWLNGEMMKDGRWKTCIKVALREAGSGLVDNFDEPLIDIVSTLCKKKREDFCLCIDESQYCGEEELWKLYELVQVAKVFKSYFHPPVAVGGRVIKNLG